MTSVPVTARVLLLAVWRLRAGLAGRVLVAPAVALAAVEVVILSGEGPPAAVALTTAVAFAMPVLSWAARQVVDADPDDRQALAALAVGGRRRVDLAGVLAACAVEVPLAVLCAALSLLRVDDAGVPAAVTAVRAMVALRPRRSPRSCAVDRVGVRPAHAAAAVAPRVTACVQPPRAAARPHPVRHRSRGRPDGRCTRRVCTGRPVGLSGVALLVVLAGLASALLAHQATSFRGWWSRLGPVSSERPGDVARTACLPSTTPRAIIPAPGTRCRTSSATHAAPPPTG